MMPRQSKPMTISGHAGSSGFCGSSAARWIMVPPSMRVGASASGGRVHERGDEADQREGLDQREAEQHVLPDQAGRLRLPGHGLDTATEDVADADAGADGGQAEADGTEVAHNFGGGEGLKHGGGFPYLVWPVDRTWW